MDYKFVGQILVGYAQQYTTALLAEKVKGDDIVGRLHFRAHPFPYSVVCLWDAVPCLRQIHEVPSETLVLIFGSDVHVLNRSGL